MTSEGFSATRRKPRLSVIVGLVVLHAALLYGLARALAPDFTASVEDTVASALTVTITAPQEEEIPPSEPEPDEGAQGDPGEKATPRPVTAPEPKVVVKPEAPLPLASAEGEQNRSGARDRGDGTGLAGSGLGTGAGRGGTGTGGAAVTKPVLLRSITDASAFPIPPGGRQARIGSSVIVRLIVSPQGRATSCSIYRPSPFPETDAAVCPLALDQLRFEPARDRSGNPVSAPFYYRQRFFN